MTPCFVIGMVELNAMALEHDGDQQMQNEKAPYEAPALEEIGSFESLTRATTSGGFNDLVYGQPLPNPNQNQMEFS